MFAFYYDGDLLIAKNWTATPDNDGSGVLKLSAVDLWANSATPVYYDDMSITTGSQQQPKPSLQISSITGSKGTVTAVIENTGNGDATNISWTIAMNGGFLLKGKSTPGSIPSILIGASATATSEKVLGFGEVSITVTANCVENTTAVTGTASGFVFLFWIIGVK